MSDEKKPEKSKYDEEQDKMYRDIITKEMLKKIESRIEGSDTEFIKALKMFIEDRDVKTPKP